MIKDACNVVHQAFQLASRGRVALRLFESSKQQLEALVLWSRQRNLQAMQERPELGLSVLSRPWGCGHCTTTGVVPTLLIGLWRRCHLTLRRQGSRRHQTTSQVRGCAGTAAASTTANATRGLCRGASPQHRTKGGRLLSLVFLSSSPQSFQGCRVMQLHQAITCTLR